MEKNTVSAPPENVYQNLLSENNIKLSENNIKSELPQSVNNSYPPTQQPQNPQQPYPNTLPVYYVQPYSARLASPPSDYFAWSVTNTVCALLCNQPG